MNESWPGSGADTAGVGWLGRELTTSRFAGDLGAADPALAGALREYAAGRPGIHQVVALLALARVLVPVVARPGDQDPVPAHVRGDKGAELALTILVGADGSRGLPVFTGLAALARWSPTARPVPVTGALAAACAVSEGCVRLVVDPGDPAPVVVPRSAVWALGQGRRWLPPGCDPELVDAVLTALRPVPDLLDVRCESAGETTLRVVLGIRRGLCDEALRAQVNAVKALLAQDEVVTERVEALELKILPV
jgi:hypothetical protein